MKTQTKVIIGAIIALSIALPLMSIIMVYSDQGETGNSSYSPEERARQFILRQASQHWRPRIAIWFFKDAETVTVEGTVVAHGGHMLIVTTNEGERLNIVLPGAWNVDSEVIRLLELCEEGYISVGDEVTVEALEKTVTNQNGVTVTGIFGYEMVDETNGNHLYAVLPFNIEK